MYTVIVINRGDVTDSTVHRSVEADAPVEALLSVLEDLQPGGGVENWIRAQIAQGESGWGLDGSEESYLVMEEV